MKSDGYLTTTTSACATCARLIPARVHVRDGAVWLLKWCPAHGPQEARVSSDAAAYLDAARYHRAGAMPHTFGTAPDRKWLAFTQKVSEGVYSGAPFDPQVLAQPPRDPGDEVMPFTNAEVEEMLRAANPPEPGGTSVRA